MGRIRTLKPELLEDEKVGALSHIAFRAFIGAITLADDYGNLRARASWFRGQVFWGRDEIDDAQVEAALAELDTVGGDGLITLYEVRGQRYAAINGWEKHQRVDKPGKPRIPSISESSRDSRETLATDLGPRTPTEDQDPDHRPRASETRAGAREAESPAGAPPDDDSGGDFTFTQVKRDEGVCSRCDRIRKARDMTDVDGWYVCSSCLDAPQPTALLYRDPECDWCSPDDPPDGDCVCRRAPQPTALKPEDAPRRVAEALGLPESIRDPHAVYDRMRNKRAAKAVALALLPTEPEPAEEPLVELPCRKTGETWPLTERVVSELEEAYPGVDVVAEARKAKAWLLANPERRKTRRGMRKFVTGWISRAVDSNRYARAATGPPRHQAGQHDEEERARRAAAWLQGEDERAVTVREVSEE